ncbi:Serine/threonine protein kinase ppk15 [Entamoeba marina]
MTIQTSQLGLWSNAYSLNNSSIDTVSSSNNSDRIIVKVTVDYIPTLQKYDPNLDFSHLLRKTIYNPIYPTNGKDNEYFDLILYSDDYLGSVFHHRLFKTFHQQFGIKSMKKNSKYQVLGVLGHGSFGQVVRCIDTETKDIVAIKVLKNQLVYLRQGMLEISVLTLLNDYYDPCCDGHTVRMYDHFIQDGHLCIVFELLGINLYEALKQNGCRGFPVAFNQSVCKQLLESLSVLHQSEIIHCDLKPENILLVGSPEVILGIPYSSAIDMWSFGCVVAELFLGIPLFPGSSEFNQLLKIINFLGMPDKEFLRKGSKTDDFFWRRKPSPQIIINDDSSHTFKTQSDEEYFNYHSATNLEEIVSNIEFDDNEQSTTAANLLDFLKKIFVYDPSKRMTPKEALSHPFLSQTKSTIVLDNNNNVTPVQCVQFSGDEAQKIVIPTDEVPTTYTAEVFYNTFFTALQRGIILNILDPNPFVLPTLAVFHPEIGYSSLCHRLSKSIEFDFQPLPNPKSPSKPTDDLEDKKPVMNYSSGVTITAAVPLHDENILQYYEEDSEETNDYYVRDTNVINETYSTYYM